MNVYLCPWNNVSLCESLEFYKGLNLINFVNFLLKFTKNSIKKMKKTLSWKWPWTFIHTHEIFFFGSKFGVFSRFKFDFFAKFLLNFTKISIKKMKNMLSWKSQWTFICTIFYSNKKEDDNNLVCYFFLHQKNEDHDEQAYYHLLCWKENEDNDELIHRNLCRKKKMKMTCLVCHHLL